MPRLFSEEQARAARELLKRKLAERFARQTDMTEDQMIARVHEIHEEWSREP